MAPFAGYDMPIHYPLGILKEHLHTRAAAGLFDVSHMGQIEVFSPNGGFAQAALALERLIPVDILGLPAGRQRYGFLTNAHGGIIDDVMIARIRDRVVLIVNAANKEADMRHLTAELGAGVEVRESKRALLALQGPQAEAVLREFAPDMSRTRFLDVRLVNILGVESIVSRSGYAGEDGFEISVPQNHVEEIARALLENPAVGLIGLGARDSLRLEAGLPLHGADIDQRTTPVEAGLDWAIAKSRREGGARAGGFPGADVILQQLANGAPRRRVGLRPEGRAPVRAGAPLLHAEGDETPVGMVTSGGFGPTVQAPIAMGYLPTDLTVPGQAIFTVLRNQSLKLEVAPLPFIPTRFKRA